MWLPISARVVGLGAPAVGDVRQVHVQQGDRHFSSVGPSYLSSALFAPFAGRVLTACIDPIRTSAISISPGGRDASGSERVDPPPCLRSHSTNEQSGDRDGAAVGGEVAPGRGDEGGAGQDQWRPTACRRSVLTDR